MLIIFRSIEPNAFNRKADKNTDIILLNQVEVGCSSFANLGAKIKHRVRFRLLVNEQWDRKTKGHAKFFYRLIV